MKFADFLRGAEGVVVADVTKVIATASAAVSATTWLPAGLKTIALAVLASAQSDITGLEAIAGTAAGALAADAVDDVTTLLANTISVVTSGKSIADMSTAEKAQLQTLWQTMKAQGDTLITQVVAGVEVLGQQTKAQVGQLLNPGLSAAAAGQIAVPQPPIQPGA